MLQTAIISDLHDWHRKIIVLFKKFGCKVKNLKFMMSGSILVPKKKKF